MRFVRFLKAKSAQTQNFSLSLEIMPKIHVENFVENLRPMWKTLWIVENHVENLICGQNPKNTVFTTFSTTLPFCIPTLYSFQNPHDSLKNLLHFPPLYDILISRQSFDIRGLFHEQTADKSSMAERGACQ